MAQACYNDRQYFLIEIQNNDLERSCLTKSENKSDFEVYAVELRTVRGNPTVYWFLPEIKIKNHYNVFSSSLHWR